MILEKELNTVAFEESEPPGHDLYKLIIIDISLEFTTLFQMFLPFDKLLLPLLQSAKQRLVLEEWPGLLLVLMMFNEDYLLLINYNVLIGDDIQNMLD